jgi:hypothetical protein
MEFEKPRPKRWKTLLLLARASNLPTVWSNCLAGWLLGGGGSPVRFPFLLLGATLIYTGGMFLNDAFDAAFDRMHRPERPIPSGAIEEREVWRLGFLLLALGLICLVWMSKTTALLAFVMVLLVLLYDAIHKLVVISPVIMAGCRFFLLLVAASAATHGADGIALWAAFSLAFYVAGLSFLARKEAFGTRAALWPSLLIAAPVILNFLFNDGAFFVRGLLLTLLFLAWTAWRLRYSFRLQNPNVGYTVSGLLAGIGLTDLIATCGGPGIVSLGAFVVLFAAARLFQRFIPAT